MQKKLLITRKKEGIVTALLHDGKAVELSLEENNARSLVGNIYIGKVTNIVKNIRAAFVEIEDGTACYLDLAKSAKPIRVAGREGGELVAGDEVLVQVYRDSAKTKAPSLTAELSLPGKYLVLVVGRDKISFSSKLAKDERERLEGMLKEQISGPEPGSHSYGWIVRTNASGVGEAQLREEMALLRSRCDLLLSQAAHRPCRTCLYRSTAEYLNRIRDLRASEFDEILTDDPDIFTDISGWLEQNQPEDAKKLRMYQDRMLPMDKLYSLETAFSGAVKERVWLKSGGYLVIQPTEALTVIDVNSGKFDGSQKQDGAFLKINIEAARESARQMRLRNLSGIIIIDFINMKKEEHRGQVMQELGECLRKDPGKAVLVDMTPLGLVEVTRKRSRKTLAEQLGKELVERLQKY
ncbi:MAG: ribonuclease E/G [Eubacteriales bacterium]|nr:ribonuclease E/G [Eubacteriales bacterium]